ncbi:nucleotide-binding universal stress UspA family protein [Hydrogenophaga palleronii]|uniref:Nucleotide-binding universal stress UspA family protein n=1 Tax=Hydrogenophaga palleronii TaxID=65655 RepID=A0ABU1WQ11_9BURK|nr:universal stress protein [Hydrogenophaga palleronii]MDR7151383.1 nucleotide-binding universal stress UspA family protein [Hydrogenophaga palleronii]
MTTRNKIDLNAIVVATDFSTAARRATDRAALIARDQSLPLHLLHVVHGNLLDDMKAWLDNSKLWQVRMSQQTRKRLDDEGVRLLGELGGDLILLTHIVEGPPVSEICEQADAVEAGLVVVGVRGTNPLHHLLIGTTAERLMGKTNVPLLAVRTEASAPYQRVLVPLDFSRWSEHAVDVARAVAPGAHLVLMHSFSIPFEEKLRFAGVDDATLSHYRERARQDARDHLEALVDRHSLLPDQFTLSLTEGDAPMHILMQAGERACDLIVIGKHGRQAAEELLLGSVTRHVLAEAEVDVLVSTHHGD